jgi:hypothetical protein
VVETPTAVVVRTRAELTARVAEWPGSATNTTWALVFVSEIPTAAELAAARQAAKICDRVAAVVRPHDPTKGARVTPQFAALVRAAGVDLAWVGGVEKSRMLDVTLGGTDMAGVDGRLILQALLAVLPLAVVVHAADMGVIRALRVVQGELGELAVVRIVR